MSARRRSTLIALVSALLWSSGCASTRLTLNLDIYTEDPAPDLALRPINIVKLRNALLTARAEAESLARDRVALAQAAFATFGKVHALQVSLGPQPAATGQDELRILQTRLDTYIAAVTSKATAAQHAIGRASASLDAYIAATARPPADTHARVTTAPLQASVAPLDDVIKSVDEAGRLFGQLGAPLGTDFEEGLVRRWPTVAKSITEENLQKLFKEGQPEPPQVRDLREEVAHLARTMTDLAGRGRRVSRQLTERLTAATAIPEREPGRLKQTIDAVAQVATSVPLSLGVGDRGAAALNDLVRSTTLFYSQIDRLQDPADPVWRIVGDPLNDAKWNSTFSETYFYSEGNNSVFVVRDTPISFRVQRSANNPTALVQGQLQVSRAVANAAIAVAGAAVGVPIPKLPGTADSGKAEAAESTDAEKLAKRDATVEQQSAVRAQAIRGLRQRLQVLRDQLQGVSQSDTKATAAALAQFRSVLNAYEAVFLAPPQ
jgi:hypothetical protein